jgi:hypothetical protein
LLAPTSVTTPAGAVAETSFPEAAKVEGAVPNEHCSAAPVQTALVINQSTAALGYARAKYTEPGATFRLGGSDYLSSLMNDRMELMSERGDPRNG